MTMLQGVLQRAVEWGRVPSNALKITRRPPKKHRPAVQAIPPSAIEVMRARLLADGKLRDGTLLVVLAYAGLPPQEALALEWRHVRERTLVVERAVSDGQLKVLKNRRQPRTVALLVPLKESPELEIWTVPPPPTCSRARAWTSRPGLEGRFLDSPRQPRDVVLALQHRQGRSHPR
jgi:integrase